MQRCKSPTSTSIYHFLQKEGATASSVGLLASEKRPARREATEKDPQNLLHGRFCRETGRLR
jgi:hypothetical protein